LWNYPGIPVDDLRTEEPSGNLMSISFKAGDAFAFRLAVAHSQPGNGESINNPVRSGYCLPKQ
jgi:hypothetical protein